MANITAQNRLTMDQDRPAFWLVIMISLVAILAASAMTQKASAAPSTNSASASHTTTVDHWPGLVLMLRHALAPGAGDPPQFNIGDCSTQRNLNETGREQSRAIGRSMIIAGFLPTRIWTSQWCRTRETAELIAQTLRQQGHPVTVEELRYLNSTFRDRNNAPDQNAALTRFLGTLDPTQGPYLMVTHQVIITDLTGNWSDSGHGVWLDLKRQTDQPGWRVEPANTSTLAPPKFVADR